MKTKRFFGLLLATVISMGGFQAALADTQTRSLEAVLRAAPEVFENQGRIGRPTQIEKQGRLFSSSERGLTLEVKNPKLEKMVQFRGANFRVISDAAGVDYIPVPKSDGSVQTAAVINSDESSDQLHFKLLIPAEATVSIIDTGEALILNASGTMLGGISSPWALDASGQTVDTWFEIVKGELIQHVDHKNGNYDYPIVADPWLGIDLYGYPYITTVSGKGYKVNVTPTAWGVSMAGPATWFAHRDEVVTKLGSASWRWTNTIQEQFYCHIAGLPLSLPEYNMESWSPLVNWFTSLTSYQCNPHSGTWY